MAVTRSQAARIVVLLLGLAVACAALAQPTPQKLRLRPYGFGAESPAEIDAYLYEPEGPPPPAGRPAVVALHGCSGLFNPGGGFAARYPTWARHLVAQGYVVLFPDSFGSRGFDDVCSIPVGQRSIRPYDRRLDVLGALEFLAAREGVARDRIALLGWSHGGSSVLATIDGRDAAVAEFRSRPGAPPFFRAAVAFYPGCQPWLRRWRAAVPLAIHIGEIDDWTPAAPCVALGDDAKGHDPPVDVHVYADSHHGFDAPRGPVRELQNVRGKETVHVGPNPAARTIAIERTDAFLRAALAAKQ
jgi:dienelactone hydrolase